MDVSGERPRPRDEGTTPPERKAASRPLPDGRRKRPAEGRYAGWGDGIDRTFCARAERFLPTTFPVVSHSGAATIAASVVASRLSEVLICTFSHCGAHVWPDGEIVADEPESIETAGENPGDDG